MDAGGPPAETGARQKDGRPPAFLLGSGAVFLLVDVAVTPVITQATGGRGLFDTL